MISSIAKSDFEIYSLHCTLYRVGVYYVGCIWSQIGVGSVIIVAWVASCILLHIVVFVLNVLESWVSMIVCFSYRAVEPTCALCHMD